jgi:hypothetical protein
MIFIVANSSTFAFAETGRKYEVTITNITRGQVITPPIVISHDNTFELFSLGAPAIPELATMAEEGDSAPLQGYLGTLSSVFDFTAASGPLMPGESVTLEIRARGKFREISSAGMLASSNDAFFAVRGLRISYSRERTAEGEAYDAGSEANKETCEFIPGPPCGNHVHDTDEAEGYVHVHAGIQGIGDLDPAVFDWRNPVAEIRIRPVR